MSRLVQAGRLVFGGWMLVNGLGYFLGLFAPPAGSEPLASQLMSAFVDSGLLGVAMAIQIIAGALLLANLAVPFALAALMPLSACAVYWALVLEGHPLFGALALVALALNGLLMLTHLDHYRDVLQPHALAYGETKKANYRRIFVNPRSAAPRGEYIGGLAVLLAAIAFYYWVVPFANGTMGLYVLAVPAVLLLAGWVRERRRRRSSGLSR